MRLADRSSQIQPSQTLAITALVAELRRNGKDVIDLGAGEPDFETPDVVKEAAIQAIRDGFTHYTTASGTLELKEAICEKYRSESKLEFEPANVVVSCGAKHSIANALLALCQAGDEVIIPAPYWTSYIEQVRFVDATPVLIPTDDSADFKISPEQLADAISDRTKMLLLNSPSNPTGSIYTEAELRALADVLNPHDFYILFDEIYDKIIYDGHEHFNPASFAELKERVIVVNGASKVFAMTGWRIGYLAAHPEVAKAVAKIQSHTTSNPCSISQKASLAAFKAGSGIYADMVREFDRRRKYLVQEVRQIPNLECTIPGGAFYLFPNISRYLGARFQDKTIATPIDFCAYLLKEAGIALVPGEAFGSAEHVRISYATSMDNLEKAVSRLTWALEKLQV